MSTQRSLLGHHDMTHEAARNQEVDATTIYTMKQLAELLALGTNHRHFDLRFQPTAGLAPADPTNLSAMSPMPNLHTTSTFSRATTLLVAGVTTIVLALALACSAGVNNEDGATFNSHGDGDGDAETGDPTAGDGDTGMGMFCGDQICNAVGGETCASCPADCDACPFCGDGTCNGVEDCTTCALDCDPCPGCGDGVCTAPSETCATCPQDCVEGCNDPVCGDGICNGTESCDTCDDCGDCGPSCGDGVCNGAENCGTCEQDCGGCVGCPNGICEGQESCDSCPRDCGQCSCPCGRGPEFDNFCDHDPSTPGCPMTWPGGFCDPNGDGSYMDGDWNLGWFLYADQCG